jgi:hypothetical protein
MKETLELRINYDYANLLFRSEEGKNVGTSVKVVELTKEDPRYRQVPIIAEEIKKKYDMGFFFGWEIKRKYSKKELESASLLHLKIKTVFEPAGEEYGTLYDENAACEICGANRKQISPLALKNGSVPKKDIARTIAGEVVVSEKFLIACKQRVLKGLVLAPIDFDKGTNMFFQLTAAFQIKLSHNTITGVNPFDLSTSSEGEIYKCPKGDTIGLNLLSEPYVENSQSIGKYDFFASKQKVGVKRGLLRPEPIYFCSQALRKMIEEEKLTGFEFEIANIE